VNVVYHNNWSAKNAEISTADTLVYHTCKWVCKIIYDVIKMDGTTVGVKSALLQTWCFLGRGVARCAPTSVILKSRWNLKSVLPLTFTLFLCALCGSIEPIL
jgi:hypothetical protein